MGKLKLLLALLMGTLVVFTAQRVYCAKTDTLDSIYSDIIFTRLAVEAQQYTRQIEYGIENGKSLENFYNIQTVLGSVKRCYSYTSGAYIVSDDYRLLYSNADDGAALTAVSVGGFDTGDVYSVYGTSDSYLLTLPIRGRGEQISGYLVLRIEKRAVGNTLSEFYAEYKLQAAVLSALMLMLGSVLIIHTCRDRERVFGRSLGINAGIICGYIAADGAISVYKLLIMIESIIQQSISKITLSLQNDLDTVQQKGVSIGSIVDFNSWLFESGKNVPFIESITYDKNYRITAAVSEDYIWEQIGRYAAVMLAVLLIFAAALLALWLAVGAAEKYFVKRKVKNARDALKDL